MAPIQTSVSVLVCTRHRAEKIGSTIRSILQNDHPDFEVIVLDQSLDTKTADVLEEFQDDPRLRYLPSTSIGLGRARNIGLRAACSDLVLMTDDDCLVPTNWIAEMVAGFADFPDCAVLYCNVEPVPYDAAAGFVPAYAASSDRRMRSLRQAWRWGGIGAGMAVRRSSVLAFGGFDEMLGAGSHFPSYEDRDIAIRALLKGYTVCHTSRTAVKHDGFRTWKEGRELARRDWLAIGAGHAKLLRYGSGAVLLVMGEVWWYDILLPALHGLLRLHRPPVFMRVKSYRTGFSRGWRTAIDRETLCFRAHSRPEVAGSPFSQMTRTNTGAPNEQ